ncbi:MAG: phytoene desaturase family protein, partial [Raoultibacter sp.]
RVEPMLEINFASGEHLPLSNNLSDLTATLEAVSEQDAQGYFQYLGELYKRYLIAKDNFLQRPFRKPSDFYNPKSLVAGFKLHTLGDAYSSVAKYVQNDRLREALAFQTLYIGISPYEGPSLYMIIPMIELLYGVWFIKGGMYSMAQGMERLFEELGGIVHTEAPVERIVIENGRAIGIVDNKGMHSADYVVCNADFPYAIGELVKDAEARGKYTPEKVEAMEYSCSCFIMYLGLDKQYPIKSMHTIRFAADFKKNIADIFDTARFPADPSFYLYAPSVFDPSLAPEGMQTLYVLVPVPPLSAQSPAWTDEDVAFCRGKILDLIESETEYCDIRNHIVYERIYTPLDFESRFNASNGATFGLRPTLFQSNYWRPHNKATHCENRY